MSTIKNGQISLYYHFNEMIQEPETSFQFSNIEPKTFLKCLSYNTLVFDQI